MDFSVTVEDAGYTDPHFLFYIDDDDSIKSEPPTQHRPASPSLLETSIELPSIEPQSSFEDSGQPICLGLPTSARSQTDLGRSSSPDRPPSPLTDAIDAGPPPDLDDSPSSHPTRCISVDVEVTGSLESSSSPPLSGAIEADPPPAEAPPEASGLGHVFAYVRHSCEDRATRRIPTQIEAISSYVRECMVAEGLAPFGVREYFIETGIGGGRSVAARPQMRKMFDQMASLATATPNIHLVIYDVSRLARTPKAGREISEGLLAHKASLHIARTRALYPYPDGIMRLFLASRHRPLSPAPPRNVYKCQPEWDPRKSYGWYFPGPGRAPIEVPEEQVVLKYIKCRYEEGARVADIARDVQTRFGDKSHRRFLAPPSDEPISKSPWTGLEVTFLANKHRWVWGGKAVAFAPAPDHHPPPDQVAGGTDEPSNFKTRAVLDEDARAASRSGETLESFLARNRGNYYDGVKINRAMLKRYFTDAMPEWKRVAGEVCRERARLKGCTTDVICALLNERAPRPNGNPWPRQTAWRMLKEAQAAIEAESAA